MSFKSTKAKLLACIAHAMIMLAIIFFWNNSDFSLESESSFLKIASLIKNNTFFKGLNNNAIEANGVLFINTAACGKLITKDDSSKTWITDRKKLADFLSTINQMPGKKMILCDLTFPEPSADDSLLRAVINKTPGIYFPIEDSMQSAPLLQNLNGGFSTYTITNNWWKLSSTLNKFKLTARDGSKSIPLIMAEKYYNKEFSYKWGLLKNGNKLFFNSIYIDPAREGYSLGDNSSNKPVVFSMSDLLFMKTNYGDSSLRDYIRPYIVIGDFDKDLHKTGNDVAAGPLILFNIFISMTNGENKITFLWLSMIMVAFTGISFLILFESKPAWLKKIHNFLYKQIGKMGDRLLTNAFWIFLSAIASYIIFDKTIEILILVLWITMLEYLLDGWQRYQHIRHRKKLHWFIKTRHVIFNYLGNKNHKK